MVGGTIESEACEGSIGVNASQIERTRWIVVTFRLFCGIDQDRLAGADLHGVFSRSGINPNRLRYCRADSDLVVPTQRIDDDRQEITLGRKQLLEIAQFDAFTGV